MDTYNGWANYETWNIALHLNGDQGSHEYWAERAAEFDCVEELADELQYQHEETFLLEKTGFQKDLLLNAMGKVDWVEIAQIYIDDAKE